MMSESAKIKPHYEYVGNLHVHSTYSDGSQSVSQIAQSAKSAGLDFVILNDHDTMTDHLALEEEGFYHGLLLLCSLEIGGRYHHYLAYDIKEIIRSKDKGPQEIIDQVNKQGGFGYLAHPFEKGMPYREDSIAYTWNDLSVTGYTGICIWNFMSRWKEKVKNALLGLFFLFFRTYVLEGPSREVLSFWDKKCQQQRVVAIGGSDAHGTTFKWHMLKIIPFSYDYLMQSINVHILLEERMSDDFSKAKAQVYGALKEGRLFITHENLGQAAGFRVYCVLNDGSTLTFGEEKLFQPGRITIAAPIKAEITLFRNGQPIAKHRGQKMCYELTQKGVYRVEIYRHHILFGWRPWIFSNPVYLR